MSNAPTERFSNRVDNYVKYRPGYPVEVLTYLKDKFGLSEISQIADIGSGTGIFTKLLLDDDYTVYAVEPNGAMRQAAEDALYEYRNFYSINGTAEATGLPAESIGLIVCAQAFHWFNNAATRQEFKRILKDEGNVALIWNNRLTDSDEFLKAYDGLLKSNAIDYNTVNHQNINDIDFRAFFKNGEYEVVKFPNAQVFDEEGLIGRAYSSSYVPAEDTAAGQQFLPLLKDLFAKYKVNGKIMFRYETEVYSGRV